MGKITVQRRAVTHKVEKTAPLRGTVLCVWNCFKPPFEKFLGDFQGEFFQKVPLNGAAEPHKAARRRA